MTPSARFNSISLSLVLAVASALSARAQQPPQWTELGGSAKVGGISSATNLFQSHALIVDRQGRPVVAWVDSLHVYVRRWNGSAWEELGGSATGAGISGSATVAGYLGLAVDPADNPCVAYTMYHPGSSSNADIYLLRWNGSSWAELGGSASGGGISGTSSWSVTPTLAFDAAGNPSIAWSEYVGGGSYEIYLRRWEGQQWVEMGDSATGAGISAMSAVSFDPRIALTPAGNPVVAWRFDPGSATLGTINYANQELCLRVWNGTDWQDLGGSGTESGVTAAPTGLGLQWDLDVDGFGYPVLAWQELQPADIFLRRWNGTAWVALGNSDSAGGLSNSASYCGDPSLVLDGAGNPIVAWNQGDTTPGLEICLRRWTGTSWEPIEGSGESSGISNSSDASMWPRMAISPLGAVSVAWLEDAPDEVEVWLKRWDNPPDFKQRTPAGADIEIGGVVGGDFVRGVSLSEVRPNSLTRIEIEMRPAGVPFTGVATHIGDPIGTGPDIQALAGPLAPGGWHWRARLSLPGGESAEWVSFGDNPESEADFTVVLPPPGGDGSSGGGGCGLTGLEAVLVAMILAGIARSRRRGV